MDSQEFLLLLEGRGQVQVLCYNSLFFEPVQLTQHVSPVPFPVPVGNGLGAMPSAQQVYLAVDRGETLGKPLGPAGLC